VQAHGRRVGGRVGPAHTMPQWTHAVEARARASNRSRSVCDVNSVMLDGTYVPNRMMMGATALHVLSGSVLLSLKGHTK
jgi:hypothetical protein